MKEFFKMVFASMLGFLLFILLIGFLGVLSIMGMIASSEATKEVEDKSVMVLNLSGTLNERSENIPGFLSFLNFPESGLGLEEVLDAIRKAKENDKIKGIYIESGMFSPDSWASLQAIRRALADFKSSGKKVVAYGDSYSQETYYIASVADKVYLNPEGMLDWHGIASEPMFFKDLMAKFGVKMQLAKVGKYKSFPETFTADKMSDANREQITAFINGIWKNVCNDVSASRKISIDSLNAYADRLVMLEDPKELLAKRMVDGFLYTDQVKDEVKKIMGLEADDEIDQLGIADMTLVQDKRNEGDQIAVYYACGDIVVGNETSNGTSSGYQIASQKVCRDLQNLMDDDDVKAVVLRINSGGGSAYASEQIWRQVELLKKKKPVVVSMGGMAASGGYYISSGSSWIVAEPTTLTGSIGIFGMFPDMSGLLKDKLGVKFDEVKTNRNSTFGTKSRPFTEQEIAYLEKYVERGYKLFTKRVADGRKMTATQVEAIAQGRVWIGEDALRIKLVDQLGGLDTAVSKAAKLAKLSEYYTENYPARRDLLDELMNGSAGTDNYLDERMRAALGEYYQPLMMLKTMPYRDAIQARIPFDLRLR